MTPASCHCLMTRLHPKTIWSPSSFVALWLTRAGAKVGGFCPPGLWVVSSGRANHVKNWVLWIVVLYPNSLVITMFFVHDICRSDPQISSMDLYLQIFYGTSVICIRWWEFGDCSLQFCGFSCSVSSTSLFGHFLGDRPTGEGVE